MSKPRLQLIGYATVIAATARSYKYDALMPGEAFRRQTGAFSLPAKGQRIVSIRFPAG